MVNSPKSIANVAGAYGQNPSNLSAFDNYNYPIGFNPGPGASVRKPVTKKSSEGVNRRNTQQHIMTQNLSGMQQNNMTPQLGTGQQPIPSHFAMNQQGVFEYEESDANSYHEKQ
mmetsp:Transcript_16750/g.28458  ORF Transcript_16750/g.28458 Transcript_16750/m.28458 type:complete len:114 (+) Transcript_16750:3583-3924(+)